MKRHLAIPLALGLAAALPTATIGADVTAPALPQTAPALLEEMTPGTTSYGCCWIYFLGRWYCVPCG